MTAPRSTGTVTTYDQISGAIGDIKDTRINAEVMAPRLFDFETKLYAKRSRCILFGVGCTVDVAKLSFSEICRQQIVSANNSVRFAVRWINSGSMPTWIKTWKVST